MASSASYVPRTLPHQHYPPYTPVPHNFQYQQPRDPTLPRPNGTSQEQSIESAQPIKRQRLFHGDSTPQPYAPSLHRFSDSEERHRMERDQSPSTVALARSAQSTRGVGSSTTRIAAYDPHELSYEHSRAHAVHSQEYNWHRRSYSAPGNEPMESNRDSEFDPRTPASDSSPAYSRRRQHHSLQLATSSAPGSGRHIFENAAPEGALSNPPTIQDSENSPSSSASASFRCFTGPDPNPYREIKGPPSPGGLSQRSSIDSRVSAPHGVQLPPLTSLVGRLSNSGSDPYAYKSFTSPNSRNRPPSTNNAITRVSYEETPSAQNISSKRKQEFD